MPSNRNSEVLLTFKSKTARHDFMSAAIRHGGFSYKLNQKSVLMAAHDEARLKNIFGSTKNTEQQYELSSVFAAPRGIPVRPISYQEAQQVWDRYAQKVNDPTRNSVFDLDI